MQRDTLEPDPSACKPVFVHSSSRPRPQTAPAYTAEPQFALCAALRRSSIAMPRGPAPSPAQAVPVSPTAAGMLGGGGWGPHTNLYFASAALEAPIAAASPPPPLAFEDIEPFGLGLPLGLGR